MKYSKQRELIYQTVLRNPVHPSADGVYAMVREQLPNISLGTVYRNLNLLADEGLLMKISMPNTSDHFDGRVEAHQHILCEKCGKVFDLEIPPVQDMVMKAAESSGFQITGCSLSFTGICEHCRIKS